MECDYVMTNPSNTLRRLKPDLTPYLFHFTGGSDPAGNMKSILSQKKLISSKGYLCFTDSPLTMLGEELKYMDNFPRPMYSQYGIGFVRDVLITDFRCRPVIYGDVNEQKIIDASLLWRYEPLDVVSHDYTWLREWRINGYEFDFSNINPSNIVVVAPNEEALQDICADVDFDVDFDYDSDSKESHPYLFYTICRMWKGVPLSQAASYKDDNEMLEALELQEIGEEIK